jgi:tellurite resistance protein
VEPTERLRLLVPVAAADGRIEEREERALAAFATRLE